MDKLCIKDHQFYRDLERLKKITSSLLQSIEDAQTELEDGYMYKAYERSIDNINKAEEIANISRVMPISLGYKSSLDDIRGEVIKSHNTEVSYIGEGEDIFYVRLPSLLNKKESGNVIYIRATLQFILEEYFNSNIKKVIEDKSVIVIKHNYSKDRSYRKYRDHDNIEVNAVIDLIALYVLIDDSPKRCDHYYLSGVSEEDNTEIYVVPENRFNDKFLNSIKG